MRGQARAKAGRTKAADFHAWRQGHRWTRVLGNEVARIRIQGGTFRVECKGNPEINMTTADEAEAVATIRVWLGLE